MNSADVKACAGLLLAGVLSAALLGCGSSHNNRPAEKDGEPADEPASDAGDARDADAGDAAGGATTDSGSDGGAAGAGAPAPAPADDPNAEQRAELVDDYCSLLEVYPCMRLDPSGLGGIDASNCREALNAIAYENRVDLCWPQWTRVTECYADHTFSCPCSGSECVIPTYLSPTPGEICQQEQIAFAECRRQDLTPGMLPPGYRTIEGEAASCTWLEPRSVHACNPECVAPDLAGHFGVRCDGPPGGPLACDCLLNERKVVDSAGGDADRLYGASCEQVAQRLADGACIAVVDCCVSWIAMRDGSEPVEQCGCTADPGAAGHASCEEAAAAAGGEVVDLCPQYRPNTQGSFPGL